MRVARHPWTSQSTDTSMWLVLPLGWNPTEQHLHTSMCPRITPTHSASGCIHIRRYCGMVFSVVHSRDETTRSTTVGSGVIIP